MKKRILSLLMAMAMLVALLPTSILSVSAATEVQTILCVGDSLTVGVGSSNGQTYPFWLGSMLGSDYKVVNRGRSGATMGVQYPDNTNDQQYRYLESQPNTDRNLDLQQTDVESADTIIIMLGTNDTKYWKDTTDEGYDTAKANYVDAYKTMINTFVGWNADAEFILATPPTADKTNTSGWAANAWMADMGEIIKTEIAGAGQTDAADIKVIDIHAKTAAWPDDDTLWNDDVHFSNAGYKALAALFYEEYWDTTVHNFTVEGVEAANIKIDTDTNSINIAVDGDVADQATVTTATNSNIANLSTYTLDLSGLTATTPVTFTVTTNDNRASREWTVYQVGADTDLTRTVISDQKQLMTLQAKQLTGHYQLAKDITVTDWNTAIAGLSGTFDGNGHTITITGTKGLFETVTGTVQTLTVAGTIAFDNSTKDVGGIAHHCSGGVIDNCTVSAVVSSQSDRMGGVVGLVSNGGKVSDCTLSGTVTGTQAVGGIVGTFNTNGTVENCTTTAAATVSGTQFIGGVVGRITGGTVTIRHCVNNGGISSTGGRSAGILGDLEGSGYYAVVDNCVNNADFGATTVGGIGGIVGNMQGGSESAPGTLLITNCHNTGDLTGTNHCGGVIGRAQIWVNLYVINSYNTGALTFTGGSKAGIAGCIRNNAVAHVYNCWSTAENMSIYVTESGATVNAGSTYTVHSGTPGDGSTAMTLAGMQEESFAKGLDGYQPNDTISSLLTANDITLKTWIYTEGSTPVMGTEVIGSNGGLFFDENGVLLISKVADLEYFVAQAASDDTISARMTADVVWPGEWVTITKDYKGTFDGDGHTLIINQTTQTAAAGLFQKLAGAGTIKNLTIDGTLAFDSCSTNIGAFAAAVQGTVDNYIFKGTITAPTIHLVGGIAGLLEGGTVQNSTVTGSISGYQRVGGIAGTMNTNGRITGCTFSGSVMGANQSVGGIVGRFDYGTIDDCVVTKEASVTASVKAAGGIAGESWTNTTVTIRNCEMHGSVSSGQGVGGIWGFIGNDKHVVVVEDCDVFATATLASGSDVGGIVGHRESAGSLTIKNCINRADIGAATTAGENRGGLLGYAGGANSVLRIENSINYGDVNANKRAGGMVGRINDAGHSATVTGCTNYGNITTGNQTVAGIVGHVSGNGYTDTIEDCINYGKVTNLSSQYNGGIVGLVQGGLNGEVKSQLRMEDCVNYGTVAAGTDGVGGSSNGGVAGYVIPKDTTVMIVDCINNGSITAGNEAGGMIGQLGDGDDVTDVVIIANCVNTATIGNAAGNNNGGIIGRVQSAMGLYILNCGNSGEVLSRERVGGIAGNIRNLANVAIDNCYTTSGKKLYYLDGGDPVVTVGTYSMVGDNVTAAEDLQTEDFVATMCTGAGTLRTAYTELLTAYNVTIGGWRHIQGGYPVVSYGVLVKATGKYGETLFTMEVTSAEELAALTNDAKVPALGGYVFAGWNEPTDKSAYDLAYDMPSQTLALTPVYAVDETAKNYTIAVTDATAVDGSGEAVTNETVLSFDQRITVTGAKEGTVAYWVLDGAKVGFGQNTYTFYISGNNVIAAVYESADDLTADVVLQQATYSTNGDKYNLTVIAQTSLPEGYELVSCGVYYAATVDALKTLTEGSYLQVVSSKSANQQYMTHLLNVVPGRIRCAVAYAVVSDGNNTATIVSDTVVQFVTTTGGVTITKGVITP